MNDDISRAIVMKFHNIDIPEDLIANFCRRRKVVELALFGSVLRDDFGPDSDIDVLVTFTPDCGWSLWDLFDMREELHQIFGREVDLVEKDALRNPFRKHEILRTYKVVYAA
jgi:predicted nucleotidyltransferase